MCILVIIQDPVTYICGFFRLKIYRQQHQCYLTVTRSGFIIKKQQLQQQQQQLKSDLGSPFHIILGCLISQNQEAGE